jgi:hypothetical protein
MHTTDPVRSFQAPNRGSQFLDRVLAERGDEVRSLEQPPALLRPRPVANVGVVEYLGERSPARVLAQDVADDEVLLP